MLCGLPWADSIFVAFNIRGNCIVTKYFSCREWWYFALNANLHEIREQRRRCTWDFLSHRARDAVSYTDKYFSRLKGGLLSAGDKVSGPLSCVSGLRRIRMSFSQRLKKMESVKKSSPLLRNLIPQDGVGLTRVRVRWEAPASPWPEASSICG